MCEGVCVNWGSLSVVFEGAVSSARGPPSELDAAMWRHSHVECLRVIAAMKGAGESSPYPFGQIKLIIA